jgi:hypothetical protein
LLFVLPSAMAAAIVAVVAAGAGAGMLWLFVYGDNGWPPSADHAVVVLAVLVSLATLAALLFASYQFGKRREASTGVSRRHVAFAIGLSILLPALVVVHQWHVGNVG